MNIERDLNGLKLMDFFLRRHKNYAEEIKSYKLSQDGVHEFCFQSLALMESFGLWPKICQFSSNQLVFMS